MNDTCIAIEIQGCRLNHKLVRRTYTPQHNLSNLQLLPCPRSSQRPSDMPFIATDPRAGGSTIYEIPLPELSQYRSTGKRTQNRGDLREHMDEKLRE